MTYLELLKRKKITTVGSVVQQGRDYVALGKHTEMHTHFSTTRFNPSCTNWSVVIPNWQGDVVIVSK
jgi:hypothetical protein